MKLTRLVLAAASFALLIPGLTAQTYSPVQERGRRHLTINERRELQQQRIGQGIRNGSLTAPEAARLERQQARLNREIRGMRSDGRFTARERARVQHQQNRLSRHIYRQKHDRQFRHR